VRVLFTLVGAIISLTSYLFPEVSSAQAGNFPARPLYASSTTTLGDIRPSENQPSVSSGLFTIHDSQNGFTVKSPSEWHSIARTLHEDLKTTKNDFEKLFGDLSGVKASLILMPAEEFYIATGTPRWTNAIFFRNRIVIPLEHDSKPDMKNLTRSIRHEFLHAVTYTLSDGKCPGWLDEGLAQWMEGRENPALKPALVEWLKSHDAIPLSLLQNGFTKLDSEIVPAAYSQSLFTAKLLLQHYGLSSIRIFLDELNQGHSEKASFKKAFTISLKEFERSLSKSLIAEYIPEQSQSQIATVLPH
jgi:hypothetical protein